MNQNRIIQQFADAFLFTRKPTGKPKLPRTVKRALKREQRIKAILAHRGANMAKETLHWQPGNDHTVAGFPNYPACFECGPYKVELTGVVWELSYKGSRLGYFNDAEQAKSAAKGHANKSDSGA